ncbi:MAG: hypothetical protein AB8H80_10630 [Planctomycetota bacterium]
MSAPTADSRAAWRRFSVALAIAGITACSSESPYRTEFDDSAGSLELEILGDGFVRTGGRRIALERVVLELRQRARAMSDDQLERFVVHVRYAPGLSGDARRHADENNERLLLELDIMDLGQVRYP